ncbi:c-type cytochrome biogenesis protein CcsB [Timonella sp. A28]|uniref:c-type cytochrome biogenesis protein CcsB n=1 Tax=Timonella sp. A28 TaxID=3442640 RepID=UPI003EBF9976
MGEISDYFVWGAISAYTIAMVLFAVDLARISEEIGAKKRSKMNAFVSSSNHDEEVTAGSVVEAEPDDTPPITYVGRQTKALGIAMATTTLGVLFHAIAVVTRGLAAGRVPWANMYEFTLTGTFVAIGLFLLIQLFKEIRYIGVFLTFIAVTFLMVGMQGFHVAADSVQPALQDFWLVIHVGIAVGATGVLTVAFVVSLLQLLRDSRNNGSTLLHGEGVVIRQTNRFAWKALDMRWLEVLPQPERLEALSFRINAVGFVMWTFTIIGGAIWADEAWGRAWGWDPKEVWSFIVWVVYAAYLHARTTRGWSGRRAAYFVLIGYATVLFNFTGVNILFNGKHSYSGL